MSKKSSPGTAGCWKMLKEITTQEEGNYSTATAFHFNLIAF